MQTRCVACQLCQARIPARRCTAMLFQAPSRPNPNLWRPLLPSTCLHCSFLFFQGQGDALKQCVA